MHRRGLISADEAAVHPRRNEILRSVGHGAEVEVEVAEVEVAPGDRFVLCSDGLTGVLQDHEIAAVIQAEAAEPAVEQLIQMANERGGPDNISVQVLSIPASRRDGDPEATAPVELSEVGIQAIEAKRSERKRMRSMTIVAIGLGLCFGIYLAWRAWGPSPQGPAHNPSIEPSFESPAPSTDARARDLDQLESRVDLIEGEGAALAPSLEEPVAEDATRVQPDDSIAHRNGTDYDTKDTEDTKHTEAPAPATRSAEDSFGDEPVPARRGIPR
jgi:hypothetical protein